MPTVYHRWFRHTRRWCAYTLAALLVLVAIGVGASAKLLPMLDAHPQQVAQWLGRRAGRPIAFDTLHTEWTRRGPLLRLQGLRIGDGNALRIGEAEIQLKPYTFWLPGHTLTVLRLRGLDLTLQRADDGTWSVQGLPGQQQGNGDPLQSLDGLGELQVIDARLGIDAPQLGWNRVQFPEVDARLRVDGRRVRAGAKVLARGGGQPLFAAVDFDRNSGDGRAWAHGEKLDLSDWSTMAAFAGVRLQSGKGDVALWTRLHAHRIARVTEQLDVQQLVLQGAPLADFSAGQTALGLPRVEALARYTAIDGGWRIDAPRLRISTQALTANAPVVPQVLDGLVLSARAPQYSLQARQVQGAALFAVLGLSDRIEPQLRRWLLRARPDARLSNLVVAGRLDNGLLRAQGHLDGLEFSGIDRGPGLSGLSGEFNGDADGFAIDLDPNARLRFDWPGGFGVVHDVALQGEIAGWREGQGWRIGTPALHVHNGDYSVDARGGLWFQNDGTRPRIDLATNIDDAQVPVAKQFWIHDSMSKEAIDWLDMALVGGALQNAHAIVSGDLDDWPFRDNGGRFEADAHIAGGTIKFQPDWPAMTRVDADIAFVGNGFSIAGKGMLEDVNAGNFSAGIDDWATTNLHVDADTSADASAMLKLLRDSPLHKSVGGVLDALSASGPAKATFSMLLPLRHENHAQFRLGGKVQLLGDKLAHREYGVAFASVRGDAAYTDTGFYAEDLGVDWNGHGGSLDLREGDRTQDAKNVFEAAFDGPADVDELLDRGGDGTRWLKAYMDGRSRWNVGVAVGHARADKSVPVNLALASDLVGTSIALPAPANKDANTALPTRVNVPLPTNSGDITAALGKLLAVRVRASDAQHTGIGVQLGSDHVDAAPPANGLAIAGRAPGFDAIGWAAMARGGGNNGLPLQSIDLQVDHLLLVGGDFPGTHLRIVPSGDANTATLDGDALAGSVLLPNDANAPIVGKLARAHWQAPPAAPAPAQKDADGDFNPASIPPLQLDVADLQFGVAKLGAAKLRTQQTSSGMQIQQLQLTSPKQQIAVDGDWLGHGASQRTRLNADIDSGDLGALFDGFGVKGQLRGGNAKVKTQLAWSGSPADFALGNLQGSATFSVHDGQILQVEPGLGRVVGLFSLAELPKRLMLDFRDFFGKGFAFDHVDGSLAFGNGTARSDNIVIEGSAAKIAIKGSTDLRAQTFDQTIDVYPKSSNLLTVVGAVAGGPIGAAAGAVASAVLGKPMGAIGAKTYRVTGPWGAPKVDVVARPAPSARGNAHGGED